MFHVSEEHRITSGRQASDSSFGNNGAFFFHPIIKNREIFVIASDGLGWEHVSAHIYHVKEKRTLTPLWDEMCYLKGVFWDDEDVVMQLHPKRSEYVNNHPHVLHLWRPTETSIPTPLSILVGIK